MPQIARLVSISRNPDTRNKKRNRAMLHSFFSRCNAHGLKATNNLAILNDQRLFAHCGHVYKKKGRVILMIIDKFSCFLYSRLLEGLAEQCSFAREYLDRRGRKNRRLSADSNYQGPERRSGTDRRSGRDRRRYRNVF